MPAAVQPGDEAGGGAGTAAASNSGVYASGGRSQAVGAGPPDAVPPKLAGWPQLPITLRRALHQYNQTLQQGQLQLQQQPSLERAIQASADAFCSALARHYEQDRPPPAPRPSTANQVMPGGVPGRAPPVAELRHEAQVTFTALVAAQTWLAQALGELGVEGRTRSGVGPEQLLGLMREVEAARVRYAELMDAVESAERGVGAEGGGEGGSGAVEGVLPQLVRSSAGAAGGTRGGSARGAAVGVLGCSAAGPHQSSPQPLSEQDEHELQQGAVRWRNRFLRAVIAEGGPGVTHAAGPPAGRPALGPAVYQPVQLQAVAVPPSMPRPLGIWLPDECWPAGEGAGSSPAWALALPEAVSCQLAGLPQGALALAAGPSFLRPVAVRGGEQGNISLAMGRAQQQLQLHLFQLWLERQLGAGLLPPREPRPAARLALQQYASDAARNRGRDGPPREVGRLVARCRLAHMLLCKSAWHNVCCVVEQEAEEGR